MDAAQARSAGVDAPLSCRVQGAPVTCERMLLLLTDALQKSDAALIWTQRAMGSASAYGLVIVAANYQGGIQVLENLARPHWL